MTRPFPTPTRAGRWLCLLLLGGVSSGCIYRSRVEGQKVELPQTFARDKVKREAKEKVGRWWEIFNDARLDGLMARAFAQNLDLEQARARLQQAQAQLMASRAGWFPTVSGSGEVGRSKRILSEQFQFTSNTFSLSLAASYEFDIFGRTYYGHKAARHGVLAAEEALRAAYLSLAAQLAETYHLAVASRAQLVLLDRTIENRQRLVELVERRYRAGVVSALDLYQAQSTLEQARASRETFVARLETTEHALALLLGRYPGQIDAGALDALPEAVRELPGGVPSQLLLRRPDLRAAHQRLLAFDAQVGEALAAHFPTLSFSANLGQSFDPSGFFWNILGNLTAPLFQGGRIHGEYKRRAAVLREQIALFKSTLLQAVKEVEDAVVTGRSQERRVEHLRKRAEAAEGALRLSTDQYTQGLTNYLNVLTSEQAVYTAQAELISARRELISARIQLARALGGGWMDREIKRHRDEQAGEPPQSEQGSK